MALGARELRLILSIQSYGTSNFARLRRDITALEKTAKGANLNQLSVQKQISAEAGRAAAAANRVRSLEKQALTAQGIGPMRTRNRLMKELNAMGYSGIVLQDLMLGKSRANSKEAQAMVNTLRAQDRQLANINHQLGVSNVERKEAIALQARLNEEVMAEARLLDRQIARQQRLSRAETRIRGIAHVGRAAQFTGLIGTAALTMAASSAARFSQGLTLAATQARKIGEPMAVVAQRSREIENGFTNKFGKHFEGILELMNQFPASADDMTQSAYDIYSSMQVSFGGGLSLLKSFNQLALATGGDLVTATNAGITVLNNFKDTGMSTNQTLNLMVATIRFGRMHLEQFNQMLNKVAPAAKQSNQSLKDVAGAMAFLTTKIPSQPQAATGIARLLQTFRDPDFQKGINKLGVNITQAAGGVGRLKPLPVILNQMAKSVGLFEKFGGPGQLFKELTATGHESGAGRQSRIEAQNAYTLLIKGIKEYNTIQSLTIGDTVEFDKALKAMSASPGVRWQIFINQMHALALTVGEAVLPSLLIMAAYLSRAAKWFEGLNRHTRDLIVKFVFFGSVVALFGGTLVSMSANIIAAIVNLKIMRISMQAAGTEAEIASAKVGWLGTSLKILAGVGLIAIPIVMQIMRGGDPGLWGFLSGALSGAAGGAMIGSAFGPLGTAAGAGIGAITVPVVIDLISHFQSNKPKSEARKAYGEYIKKVTDDMWHHRGKVDKIMDFGEWLKVNPKYSKDTTTKKRLTDAEKWMKQYQKFLKSANRQTAEDLLKAQAQLQGTYDAQNNKDKHRHQDELAMATAHANAMQAAQKNYNEKIKNMVNSLASIYDKFQSMNKQALGDLAQGPTMQGILGQVFGGINDLLRQFGVQIPVPFSILRKDLDQQMTYFKRWREDLSKLQARVGPKGFAMVQELQAMGPTQGISIVEGLLGTNPKNLAQYVNDYKSINTAVKEASLADMNAQLTEWKKHGKDIAQAIINGMSESAALLSAKFKEIVVTNFGGILRKEFAAEVALAMKNAADDIKARTVQEAAAAADNPVVTPTGNPNGVGAKGLSIAEAQRALLLSHQPFFDRSRPQGIANPMGPFIPGARTTSSATTTAPITHYHGDKITVQAGGPAEFAKWAHRRDFVRRSKGKNR